MRETPCPSPTSSTAPVLPLLPPEVRPHRPRPSGLPRNLPSRLDPDGQPRCRRRTYHTFDEKSPKNTLADISQRYYGDGTTVNQTLEEGWKQGIAHSMADGIMSQAEEAKLREFRDRLALADARADPNATQELHKASRDRLMLDARLAALALEDADTHLQELSEALKEARLYKEEQANLLVTAFEAAVEGVLEDGLLSFDEENALARYLDHFGIDQAHADRNGAQTSMVQAAVIRELTEPPDTEQGETMTRLRILPHTRLHHHAPRRHLNSHNLRRGDG